MVIFEANPAEELKNENLSHNTQDVALYAINNAASHVLLSTALIYIKNHKDKWLVCRALLDSES